MLLNTSFATNTFGIITYLMIYHIPWYSLIYTASSKHDIYQSSYKMYILHHHYTSILPCLGLVFSLRIHLYTIYVFYIISRFHAQISFHLLVSRVHHHGTIYQSYIIYHCYFYIMLHKSLSKYIILL